MNNNNLSKQNILLCDLGGTHARFARHVERGHYDHFKKYRLDKFTAFEDIIQAYYNDTGLTFDTAKFSTARTPVDGVIQYKRFAGDPIERIDFNLCEEQFFWPKGAVPYLNDLESAAYGLQSLKDDDVRLIIKSKGANQWNDRKILISIGTGAGHAALANGHVFETAGGHFLPITVTEEQRQVEEFIRSIKDNDLSLIAEDFVSGRGLKMITEFISGQNYDVISPENFIQELKKYPKALRLFFEFFGLYAHTLVSVMGFYGGVYVTGGVVDQLIKNNLTDWDAFENYFRPNMVLGVNDRLGSIPLYYVLEDELPLRGLTMISCAGK